MWEGFRLIDCSNVPKNTHTMDMCTFKKALLKAFIYF